LSVIVSVPVAAPAAVGVKVTLKLQGAPGAKPVPQLFVSANGPVMATFENARGIPPELVTLTFCGALVVLGA
jgi:hypothetical protein